MITAKDILALVGAITLLPAVCGAIYHAVITMMEPRTRAQHPGRVSPRDCTPVHKALTDPITEKRQRN